MAWTAIAVAALAVLYFRTRAQDLSSARVDFDAAVAAALHDLDEELANGRTRTEDR